MSEISLNIEKVPSIPDEGCMESCEKGIHVCIENTCISCRHCWQHYMRLIILGIILSVIGVVVAVIVLSQKTIAFPCYGYDTNSLASTVSLQCLQYLWDTSCSTRAPYTFPAGYQGWWNQSPQGSTFVSCKISQQCGVGSYGNIAIYTSFCNIRYGQ